MENIASSFNEVVARGDYIVFLFLVDHAVGLEKVPFEWIFECNF